MKLHNPFTSNNPIIICCSVLASVGLSSLLLDMAFETFGVFVSLWTVCITALIPVLIYIFKGD